MGKEARQGLNQRFECRRGSAAEKRGPFRQGEGRRSAESAEDVRT